MAASAPPSSTGVAGEIVFAAAPQPQPPSPPSLPLGVAILSVLAVLYGIGAVAEGALQYEKISFGALQKYINWVPTIANLTGHTGALVTIVVGLILVIAAIGLWRLSMVALVLALLVCLYFIVTLGLAKDFHSIGLYAAVIIFLYLVAVNGHFR
jgi:hypothetical protein